MPFILIYVCILIFYVCIHYSDVSFYYTAQLQIKLYSDINYRLSKADLRREHIILNISSGDDKKDFESD